MVREEGNTLTEEEAKGEATTKVAEIAGVGATGMAGMDMEVETTSKGEMGEATGAVDKLTEGAEARNREDEEATGVEGKCNKMEGGRPRKEPGTKSSGE